MQQPERVGGYYIMGEKLRGDSTEAAAAIARQGRYHVVAGNLDRISARREAHLDGKWLLHTSDQTLPGDDLTAAYKQLLAGFRGWRDFESTLDLRPAPVDTRQLGR